MGCRQVRIILMFSPIFDCITSSNILVLKLTVQFISYELNHCLLCQLALYISIISNMSILNVRIQLLGYSPETLESESV